MPLPWSSRHQRVLLLPVSMESVVTWDPPDQQTIEEMRASGLVPGTNGGWRMIADEVDDQPVGDPEISPVHADPWPTLDPAAFHGLAGQIVRAIEPETEADPAAVLLTTLSMFGNAVGSGPHTVADGAQHPARLHVVVVGDTARSRKGTSVHNVRRIFDAADPVWARDRLFDGGLSTGEGVIAAVRDGDDDIEGVLDKRLLVVESEFARVLSVANRDGNILSNVIRQAWDSGNLRVITRKDPLKATAAHISIVGHITREELLRRLTDT